MANANRMYQRTEDGRRACENAQGGLPELYRQLLRLTACAADFAELRETLHEYPQAQIADARTGPCVTKQWLADLLAH